MFLSLCIFVLITYIHQSYTASFLHKTIPLLASTALGIYLIHPLIQDFLFFVLSSVSLSPMILIPLITIMTLLLSFLSVSAMKKLPILSLFI